MMYFGYLQVKHVTSEGKELLYGVDAQHLMVLNSGSDLPVSLILLLAKHTWVIKK